MLTQQEKAEVIERFARKKDDCGSCDVQIALFSRQMKKLTEHLNRFPKDKHSRQGLILLVGKRRAFLNYLRRKSPAHHEALTAKLREHEYL